MASYSRWDDTEYKRRSPAGETRTAVEHDLALGQLIYDLRTETGLSQRELAERMSTTQSVISRLEEGGGARNRIDTLARVATALDRHLIAPCEASGEAEGRRAGRLTVGAIRPGLSTICQHNLRLQPPIAIYERRVYDDENVA